MKKQLLFGCLCCLAQLLCAQKNQLTGQVFDAFTDEAIIGATVRVKQGDSLITGAATDAQGQFLAEVPVGIYDLEFSFLGMRTECVKQVKVTATETVKPSQVWLIEEAKVLGEVVITGHRARLTRGCGCYHCSQTFIIIDSLPNERSKVETQDFLLFAPNPTNSDFTIQIPDGTVKINCYQTDGQLVHSLVTPEARPLTINTNTWQSGTYIILLVHPSGSQAGKLVVQHL